MPMPAKIAQPSAMPANDHVPPALPTMIMPAMSSTQMTEMMQMDDQATRSMLRVDRLESGVGSDGSRSSAWQADAWWGDDIDQLWLETEGERERHAMRDARVDLFWSHAFTTFWDWQLGARNDIGRGSRSWMAAGLRGLAPYWFDIDATFYLDADGRTAARFEASYDLRLTQRWILMPDAELNFYSRGDAARDVHAGLSDGRLGLRLRYDISRRFAPYLGVDWSYRPNDALSPLRTEPGHELTWRVGVRFWL